MFLRRKTTAAQIAPILEALQSLSAASLEFAINEGVMYGQASVLSNAQKSQVVAYLARETDDSWLQPTLCPAGATAVAPDGRISLARFGVDYLSTRHMSSTEAGLHKENFANLELAWALAFPDVSACGIAGNRRRHGVLCGYRIAQGDGAGRQQRLCQVGF